MKTLKLPDAKELRRLFEYDPQTGSLIWKKRYPLTHRNKLHNSRDAGQPVGALDTWGHCQVRVEGKLRAAHRIIFKMMTGKDAKQQIDHINGKPGDNRWSNLREANQMQNTWNEKVRRNNTSGHPGIRPMNTKRATSKKWRVVLRSKGKSVFVGDFLTFDEAKAAYDTAFIRYRDPNFKRDIGPIAVPKPVKQNTLNSNNTSGHSYITIRPERVNAFIVTMTINDRRISRSFHTLEEAKAAVANRLGC
jgi:hypothetical protein